MACNECNKITNCDEQTNPSCSCPLKLGSICVKYDGEELITLDVEEGDDLTSILVKINDLINSLINGGLFTNIGEGTAIYKQVNLQGQAEFKTIVDTDSITVSVEGTDEIKAEVDEDWLTTYVQTFITNSFTNIGGGAEVYKGINGTDNEFRTIISNSFNVTQNSDTIQIESSSLDEVPNYIVNNLYTGDEELGTLSKPFKTITSAVSEFVGAGTADAPENEGAKITIQKGNNYSYSGNFSYRNLTVIVESGVTISHSPSAGGYFVDLDSLNDTEAIFSMEIEAGAEITLNQKGFRNRGSSGGSAEKKQILLSGEGTLRLAGSYTAGYAMIESNYANLTGYAMPSFQHFVINDLFLRTGDKQMYLIGRDSEVIFNNCILRHSDISDTIDPTTLAFDQKGGNITISNSQVFFNGTTRTHGFSQTKNAAYTCSLTLLNSELRGQTVSNLFYNADATNNASLRCDRTSSVGLTVTELFKSTPLWTTVDFSYNILQSGNIDTAQVDLTKGNTKATSNIVNGQLIESLRTFADRTTAAASLQEGAKFINTNSGSGDTSTHFIDIVI